VPSPRPPEQLLTRRGVTTSRRKGQSFCIASAR
jgi:hypothetical protein